MLTADKVRVALMQWPCRYAKEDGTVFIGTPVSQVAGQLRDCGWRSVPRLNRSDLRKLGLVVVTARYVGGVRPKKFCDVVVASDAPREACRNIGTARDIDGADVDLEILREERA